MSTIIVLNHLSLLYLSGTVSIYYFIHNIFKDLLMIQIFLNVVNVQLVALICEHTVGTPDLSTSAVNAVYALRAVKCVQMDQTERD